MLVISSNGVTQDSSNAERDYVTEMIGPWQLTTLSQDAGEQLILLAREDWGAISADSINGENQVLIQGEFAETNRNQLISIKDLDGDGAFDAIQIENHEPDFEILELRLVDGAWQMKTLIEWYESDDSANK